MSVIKQIEALELRMLLDDANILVEIILYTVLLIIEYSKYKTIKSILNIWQYDDDEVEVYDEDDDETSCVELWK